MTAQDWHAGIRTPPASLLGSLRFLGPGLILSAAIVGSGELIATTALGAKAGYAVLWVILLGCLVKVAVQLEYGRYCIAHGQTTFQGWNRGTGPRLFGLRWPLFVAVLYMLSVLVGLGGVLGGAAQVTSYAVPTAPIWLSAGVIALALALLVFHGRYKPVEFIALILNCLFVSTVVYCVLAIQWTDYAVRATDLAQGFSLRIPEGALPYAAAAFGLTGVTAGEIFVYPYWCLEKGYGAWTGPRDASPEWAERARGWMRVMTVDAFVSMAVYTLTTVAFYLLGAAVLSQQEQLEDGNELILQLSAILTEVLGTGAMVVFMAGAFSVLFSTVFANNAGFSRMWADFFAVSGLTNAENRQHYQRSLAITSFVLPAAWACSYLLVQQPLYLVVILGVANALFLLVVAYQGLEFRYRYTDARLRPARAYDVALWISVLAIGFMAWRSIQSFL